MTISQHEAFAHAKMLSSIVGKPLFRCKVQRLTRSCANISNIKNEYQHRSQQRDPRAGWSLASRIGVLSLHGRLFIRCVQCQRLSNSACCLNTLLKGRVDVFMWSGYVRRTRHNSGSLSFGVPSDTITHLVFRSHEAAIHTNAARIYLSPFIGISAETLGGKELRQA